MVQTQQTAAIIRVYDPQRVRTNQDDDQENFDGTPFALFMSALLSRRLLTVTTMAGSAEWGGMPWEEIVANGLWAVMLRVAEIYKMAMNTEDRVILNVAPLVNRMLNVGLTLAYATPEIAADAFEIEMRHALEQAVHETPIGTTVAFQDLVQLPAAQFFASLVKQAKEFVHKLKVRVYRIEQANRPKEKPKGNENTAAWDRIAGQDDDRQLWFYVSFQRYDYFINLIHALEPNTDMDLPRHPSDRDKRLDNVLYDLVPEALARLDDCMRCILLLRRVPNRMIKVPREAVADTSFMEDIWIRTQIALSIIDAPDRDYIDIAEFEPAINAAQDLDDAEILEKFLARMRSRGVRQDSDVEKLLIELAKEQIGPVHMAWPHVDSDTVFSFHVLIRLAEFEIPSERALQLATDNVKMVTGAPIDATDEEISRAVSKNVPWERMTWKDFVLILEKGEITDQDLAKGIARMPSEIRMKAAQQLYQHHEADPALLGLILQPLDESVPADLVDRYLPKASVEDLPAVLRRHLYDLEMAGMEASDKAGALRFQRFFEGLDRLHWKESREFFDDPQLRMSFHSFIVAVLRDPDDLEEKCGVPKVMGEMLILKLGWSTYYRFILASEVLLREGVYQTGHDAKKDPEMAGIRLMEWHELDRADYPHVVTAPLAVVLRVKQSKVRALLVEFPEDEIFRWFYAAEKNADKMLAKFRKDRVAYYAKWDEKNAQRKTHNAKRPKAKSQPVERPTKGPVKKPSAKKDAPTKRKATVPKSKTVGKKLAPKRKRS